MPETAWEPKTERLDTTRRRLEAAAEPSREVRRPVALPLPAAA
jgi:hypothetical protein